MTMAGDNGDHAHIVAVTEMYIGSCTYAMVQQCMICNMVLGYLETYKKHMPFTRPIYENGYAIGYELVCAYCGESI